MVDTVQTSSSAKAEAKGLAETQETFLRMQNVYKSFQGNGGRIHILNGVDLEIKTGQSVAIVGASGIGKSTLLHLLGVLDQPNQGSLWYQGTDLYRLRPSRTAHFRNTRVGFVFQFHHLLAEFSALENAMMPALIGGVEASVARQEAEEILVRVGLKDRLNQRVITLSGGEQQRVALARAIVRKPRILLADEPTGNLDEKNSEAVHQLLLELNREFNMALVVVTHNPKLASYLSSRVSIKNGHLINV